MLFREYWSQQHYHLAVIFILSLLWKGVFAQEFSLSSQSNVEVQLGLCVHIPCFFKFEEKYGTVTASSRASWYKNENKNTILVASNKESLSSSATRGHFLMTGDVQKRDCSLSINNAKLRDNGKYYFRIEGTDNLKFNYLQYQIKVKVLDIPHVIITIPENRNKAARSITVKEGDSQILNCRANSNPTANIIWKKVDKEVNKTMSGNLIFKLSNISASDNGTYSCSANNSHGTTSKNINVNVVYAPRRPQIYVPNLNVDFSKTNYTLVVLEGSLLSLVCSANSNPKADLLWMKTGQDIKKALMNGHLTVGDVTAHDQGVYTCLAKNNYGSASSSLTIVLKYKESYYPVIVIGAVCAVVLLALIILAVLMTKYLIKRTQLPNNEITKSPDINETIYSNANIIDRAAHENQVALVTPSSSLKNTQEEASVYINYNREVNYVTLKFSKLKPKSNPTVELNEETEYSEIKCK